MLEGATDWKEAQALDDDADAALAMLDNLNLMDVIRNGGDEDEGERTLDEPETNGEGDSAESEQDRIKTAFEMFDADGGGSIDACETRALLQELGVEMSEEQVLEEVNLIDADGNGDIDLREFTQRWQSQDGANSLRNTVC